MAASATSSPFALTEAGMPKPIPDTDSLTNRAYATAETDWEEDGVMSVDLEVNKRTNELLHHTSQYDVEELVVRRGDPFTVNVAIIGKAFNKNTDHIKIIFSTGNQPLESKGAVVGINICNDEKGCSKGDKWKGFIKSASDSSVSVTVTSPTHAFVGKYSVIVKLFAHDGDEAEKMVMRKIESPIYVLFNPWNENDQTYVADSSWRKEYVELDHGCVYQAGWWGPQSKRWYFGQYEKHCLEAAVYLLKASYLPKTKQGNATFVTRALTYMANNCGNGFGVLAGNWSGEYDDGTSPTEWAGSSAILEEFMTDKKPVKYGQCWVFSGLMVTLCRTLGIACRSVTNFQSAHDHDESLTIDTFYDEEMEKIEYMANDSVWNFHVWNEGWFTRPDLPEGYDGWQAFDGTPQEASESRYQCGPASVKAIKEGNLYLGYDSGFIFAEVNGDKIAWVVNSQGEAKILREKCSFDAVGQDISTKSVGSNVRDDVTSHYKESEGSASERAVAKRAKEFSWRKDALAEFYEEKPKDVQLSSSAEIEDNGDIKVVVKAVNTSSKERKIKFGVRLSAVFYNGVVGNRLNQKRESFTLDSLEVREIKLTLRARSYLNAIKSDAKANVTVTAQVQPTGQFYLMEKQLELKKPDLDLKFIDASTVKARSSAILNIEFQNPFDVKLTDVIVRLDGPIKIRDRRIKLSDVEAGEKLVEVTSVTPKYAGRHVISASFNSRQVTGITGEVVMDVAPADASDDTA